MKHTFKRVLSMLCATLMLLSCFAWSAVAAEADMGDAPSGTITVGGSQRNKWTIIGSDTTVSVAAGGTMGITKAGLGIDLPDSMPLEGLGLYMHVTHTADSAALMNKGSGQIELCKAQCDHFEYKVSDNQSWTKGENKILIPFGLTGTHTEGSSEPSGPFDLHDTIDYFRFYSLNAPVATSMVIHEISIVDVTGVDFRTVGSLFGENDTYLQMGSALTTPPSSFEASIKMDEDIVKYAGMWEIGLPANGRYSYITTTTGVVTESEAVDGLAADTPYKSYIIPKDTEANDGYFGTGNYKFSTVKIPEKYTKNDLALTFWVYWKPSVSGTPFNLYSYIELTSSGTSDSQELCWGTDRPEFKNMKEGWNQIVLPFAGASVTGGDIDLSNINFSRIWGNTSADYLATCDYELRFTSFKIIALTEEEEGTTEEKVTSWSLGLPGAMRTTAGTATPTATVDGKYYDSKDPVTGTASAEDEATYGIPAGTKYIGGTVMGGYEYEYATGETDEEGNPIMAVSNLGGGSVGFAGKKMNTVSVPAGYTEKDLALVFWFYTSTGSLGCEGKYPDVNTGRAGFFQLELTSSGTSDKEESMFSNTHAGFANVKPGWNLIILPLNTPSGRADGTLNLQNINYVRWISEGTMPEDVTIYVSEMSIVALPTVDDAFDLEYWSLGAPGAPRTDAGSYQMTAKSGTISAAEAVQYDMPYGLSWKGGTVPVGGRVGLNGAWMKEFILPKGDYTTADLDLVFWLYTSTGKLDGSKWYLELSNTGGDNYELCWYQTNPAFSNLQVGWNKIVLPLGKPDFTETGTIQSTGEPKSPFTLEKPMKYTRLWTTGAATEEVDLYFTDFFIAAHDEPDHQIVDGHETWELANFSVENGNWDGAVRTFDNVWTNDGTDALQPADGTVYMKVTPSTATRVPVTTGGVSKEAWKAGFDVSVGKGMNPPTISTLHTINDLVFSFWMYVPDASLVPTDIVEMPNFELTSDGNADGAQLEYKKLFAGGLQDGWNYIEMPLSKMSASGGFDLYNINYIRWSAMRLLTAADPADEYVYFADFRLTSTIPTGVLVDASEIDLSETYTILSTNDSTDANPITLFVNYQGNPGFVWGDKAFVAENYCAITGEWVDLALTYDAENAQFIMYANGELIAYVDATGVSAITPTVGFAVGADVDGSNLMTGMIADVRIWSDVRTQQEIQNGRIVDKEAFGAVENGLDETTEGLIGAWTLVGGIDYVLENKPDLSASGIDLVFHGSRADDWDLDYQVPEEIGEDYYSIVFIPDTQNLVTGLYTDELLAIGDWISNNIETENIVHVIGAGDTTWNDTIPEYNKAMLAWNMFSDKVSWSNMTGNHDYPWKSNTQTIRDSANYNSFFGIDYINSTMGSKYYVGSFDDPYDISGTENSYYRFNINGTPWMILQLEYHPRVSVINWANEIAQQYPDDNIILTTHSYIGTDNAAHSGHWMTYTKEDATHGGYIGELMGTEWHFNGNSSLNDGQGDKTTEMPIWTHLMYKNPNIKMLLCGHSSTTDGHVLARWDKNVAGETISQIMINAQDVDEDYFVDHAMGMIGILRFSADGSKMDIQYYSPYHKASYHPSNQNMRSHTLPLNEKAEVAGTDGLVYELNADKAGYTIVDYTGDATDVIVPETYKGLPVTAYAPRLDVTTDGDGSIVLPDDYVDGTVVEKEELTLDSITFLSKTITIVDDPATIKATTVIHGYVGSTAAAYAKALGAEFAYLASISGVSVSLGKDIGLIYSAYMTEEDAANAEMEFVMNGKTTTATAVATATAGKYTFALTGKGPHLMRDNVTARLLVNGEAVATLNDYSVRRYCTNIMGKIDAGTSLGISEAKTTALRTLIADLLEYGAAAQLYVNHKPLNLANEGITGASTYVELTDEYAPEALGATTAADGSRFISGSVELTDVVTMRIRFATTAANIANVKVTVNGLTYTSKSFTEIGASTIAGTEGLTVYEITSPAIWATQFEQKCSLVLNIDGTDCQTFNYSVVNYIYRQQNVTTNDKLVNLLRTIRNYGLSAEAYRDAK